MEGIRKMYRPSDVFKEGISYNEYLHPLTIGDVELKNNIILGRSINDLEFEKICKITHVDDIVKNIFLF